MIKVTRKSIRRKDRFFVYILECSDGTYYTGYTPNIKRRVELHNTGMGAKYTRGRGPVKLVWKKEYQDFKSALKTEMIIKKLTRGRKEELVNGVRLDKVLVESRK